MCGQYQNDCYHCWHLSLPLHTVTWAAFIPAHLSWGFRCIEPFIHLPITMSIDVTHVTLPLNYLYLTFFLYLLTSPLLFQFFMFSDYCCFSISWPFLPHNQFAQHGHYLLLFAIVLEFNNHFRSFLLGNWSGEVCECVSLFSQVIFICLSLILSLHSLLECMCVYCVNIVVKLCTAWAW